MKYMFPKVELHCHLDGSIDPILAFELAKEKKIIKENMDYDTFLDMIRVPENVKTLEEYLARFDLPIKLLQDENSLYQASKTLVINLAKQGIVYAEIRFAPQFHTHDGLTQKETIQAVLKGIEDGKKESKTIEVGLICCLMTIGPASINHDANMETVNAAHTFYGKGVVSIDLAGAEGICPMEDYLDCFELAKSYGLPYIIHAGESGPASYVKKAMDMGAKRIGHGGHCSLDDSITKEVIERKIPLEICITSNVHCKNQPSYSEHPVKMLYDRGAIVTINTDNMTLSNVDLEKEYDRLIEFCGFSIEDIKQCNRHSIEASFLSEIQKQYYLDMMK